MDVASRRRLRSRCESRKTRARSQKWAVEADGKLLDLKAVKWMLAERGAETAR